MRVGAGTIAGLATTLGIAAALTTAGSAAADEPQDAAPATAASPAPRSSAPRGARAVRPTAAAHRTASTASLSAGAGERPANRRHAAAATSGGSAIPSLPATAVPAPSRAANLAAAVAPDPISTLLNNTAPRPAGTQTAQTPAGVISGLVTANDPDSPVVSFSLSQRPAHGSVTVAPGGQFTYTADPAMAHAEYVDSFRVTASDAGSDFHIHGLTGLINLLTFGLIGASGHETATTVRITVAPFNNAPTGTVSVGGPDPVTGTVTGRVVGRDANGDALTYSGPTSTAGATIAVTAAGGFTYTPTPEALAAAVAGQQDRFTVVIDDGYGAMTPVDVVVPVGFSTAPHELSTFCGCTLMPADSVFHADVSTLPVLAQSATWTALLGGTLRASWGRAPWMGSTGGMPVNVVDPGRAGEKVIFNRGYATSGPGIDDTLYAIPDRPLVEGMPDVPAWDRHLLVFQQGTCISQELYNVANGVELPAAGIQDALGNAVYAALWGSTWIAEAGVHVDMSSALYPAQGWANASRLPYLPMILRPDDLSRGSIDHMLGISIAKDRGTGYTWPARAGDGTGTNPNGVPMGTVFRLDADFDLTGYAPDTQVVLRALQAHGAVVYDSFAPGLDGAHLLVMSNGWSGTGYITLQEELSTIPLSAFEAVDVLQLAADPASGWAIRI